MSWRTPPGKPADPQSLANRLESMNRKIHGLIGEDSGLSPSGAATAIALIVSLNLPLLSEIEAALRAQPLPGSSS